jgi:hypothetical protein
MICPQCSHANEDGVLFCERCKSDLDMTSTYKPKGSPDEKETFESPIAKVDVLPPFSNTSSAEETPKIPTESPMLAEVAASVAAPVASKPFDPSMYEETAPMPSADDKSEAKGSSKYKPTLTVLRGMKIDKVYPLYEGKNYLGRTDDKPVDIDLDEQESPDRIWCSRQHAVIVFENDQVSVEDLNSLNGTFVNRNRVHPGQVKVLQENDVVQIGTVHMKLSMN